MLILEEVIPGLKVLPSFIQSLSNNITMKKFYVFTILIISVIKTSFAQAPSFGSQQNNGLIEFSEINEASGISASRKNVNVLWLHNDSGDLARIFAINSNGEHLGVFNLSNATNRDWEDISVGPGPIENVEYIYIAEIGDNLAQFDIKYIYRIPEPVVDADQDPVNITLTDFDIIKFKYPDGQRDAETIMVDPLTNDIYVVSKREANVKVYLAAFPQSTIDTLILEDMGTLPFTNIVSGDISSKGDEILLKNYESVFYWHRNSQQTIAEALTLNQYYLLPYTREPQGEAVSWSYNSDGYYTVSEEPLDFPAHLYFYPRLDATNSESERNLDEGLDIYLKQNYPNPFNPVTKICYQIKEYSSVSLKVYNMLGQEVINLSDGKKAPGEYEVYFDAASLTNGTYFYKLQTNDHTHVKAMTLLR